MSEIIHIGILGAMPQEIGLGLKSLKNFEKSTFGDLIIYSGELDQSFNKKNKCYLSIAWSGWGKVSAARATTRMIANTYKNKKIDFLIFSGVAGGVDKNLDQWDVVIASKVVQHDMDATPLYPKFVVPAINSKYIYASQNLTDWAEKILISASERGNLRPFKNIKVGTIATGDKFVSGGAVLNEICKDIRDLKAVEMEGASFAQVAYQERLPWLIVRVISDKADHSASQSFNEFLELYQLKSWDLIKLLISDLKLSTLKLFSDR